MFFPERVNSLFGVALYQSGAYQISLGRILKAEAIEH